MDQTNDKREGNKVENPQTIIEAYIYGVWICINDMICKGAPRQANKVVAYVYQ